LALTICLLLSAVSAATLNGSDVYQSMSTLEFESQFWEHQRQLEQQIEADIQSMPDQGESVPLPPEASQLVQHSEQDSQATGRGLRDPQSGESYATLRVQLIDESYRLVAASEPSAADAANSLFADDGSESIGDAPSVQSLSPASSSMLQAGLQNKGPSAITLLVGFTAAVVVIGALFSGRE